MPGVVRPLQTISNLLLALREEDFSIRANIPNRNDPLGEVLHEINALSDTLRDQRLGALEASALLRAVMEEISVAVFAFDQEQRLKLANRAGEQLVGKTVERMLKRTAAELGLAHCLEGPPVRTLQGAFAGSMGRWAMRRSTFRQHGQPHQLLVLADLSHALRDEERQAWQRLLRVLGHELNNSLAPIRSISGSLGQMMAREPLPSDWRAGHEGRPRDDQRPSGGLEPVHGRLLEVGALAAAQTPARPDWPAPEPRGGTRTSAQSGSHRRACRDHPGRP